MIEILIAVLLIAIGFLASAKMQTQGIRNGQGAYHHAQAYLMLSDMMDRMRSNPNAVAQGAYDNQTTSSELTDPGCNTTTSCTTWQQANQDLFDWSAKLHPLRNTTNFIPVLSSSDNINASATIVPLGSGSYQLTATWVERIGSQDSAQSIVLDFTP